MIGKQIIGKSFSAIIAYALGKLCAYIIFTNMIGANVPDLAAEFRAIAALRPRLTRKVGHTSLSAARGEKLSDDTWRKVFARYFELMGFGETQFVVIRHPRHDPEKDRGKDPTQHCDHAHAVFNRVRFDGSVIDESWNFVRSAEALRTIEQEFGLEVVEYSRDAEYAALSSNELEMASRQSEEDGQEVIPGKAYLQATIDWVLATTPDLEGFCAGLESKDISVRPHIQSTGRITGFSFAYRGVVFRGRKLGKRFGFQGLQEAGLNYEQIRDDAAARARCPREPASASGTEITTQPSGSDTIEPSGDREVGREDRTDPHDGAGIENGDSGGAGNARDVAGAIAGNGRNHTEAARTTELHATAAHRDSLGARAAETDTQQLQIITRSVGSTPDAAERPLSGSGGAGESLGDEREAPGHILSSNRSDDRARDRRDGTDAQQPTSDRGGVDGGDPAAEPRTERADSGGPGEARGGADVDNETGALSTRLAGASEKRTARDRAAGPSESLEAPEAPGDNSALAKAKDKAKKLVQKTIAAAPQGAAFVIYWSRDHGRRRQTKPMGRARLRSMTDRIAIYILRGFAVAIETIMYSGGAASPPPQNRIKKPDPAGPEVG